MTINRNDVWMKYDRRCAYCGDNIQLSEMQVDHIIPKRNFHTGRVDYDVNDIRNLNPACRVCNNWKHTWSVEQFRLELSKQVERCIRASSNFRMALKYNQVKTTPSGIVFHFENLHKQTNNKADKPEGGGK